MGDMKTLKEILEKRGMKLYNNTHTETDASNIRLGLGFYHWNMTPEERAVTLQTHDAISGVVNDLVSHGLLTPEGKVFYEFYHFLVTEATAQAYEQKGVPLPHDQKLMVPIKELCTPEDYEKFNLTKVGEDRNEEYFTFTFNGVRYRTSRLLEDSFTSVHDTLKREGIPLVFPDEDPNDTALFQAMEIERLPGDHPRVQRLLEERKGIYARKLFSQGNGLQVLIAGVNDFPQLDYQKYNDHNYAYVFAAHESIESLRDQPVKAN